MSKIAVLGPPGTFTEMATKQYLKAMGLDMELSYFTSIRRTFEAIGTSCELGVIPIENTLDGFVTVILDLLTHSNLKIIHETVLPIHFSFVANAEKVQDVKKLFVQFKSHNQCLDFIENFDEQNVVITESNSQSYQELINGGEGCGAIIPRHMLTNESFFRYVEDNVGDSQDNQTRFVVLSKNFNEEIEMNFGWKTLFVTSDDLDRPGLLVDILNIFKEANINLQSIYSRPKKTGLGNYNFFIDIDGCYQKDDSVRKAIERVNKDYNIKILGSYYRV